MEKNWKDTLFMPQTDFDMKANLVAKEPEFRKFWLENKIYEKALAQNKENGKGNFIVHDGPPYANGDLHVGHALNKILKDIIVRRKTMEGYYSPFTVGWDTHGLPIENKMLEELKMSKDDLDKVTLRKEAAKYALTQVERQKDQFEQMQLFTDLKEKYVTLDKNFEVGQLELFKKMALDGLIYKGLKPVYWSPSSESALAEAEVEYQDHRSPQVIVSVEVTKGNDSVPAGVNLLIMTTTPWTLPANSGIAIGENFNYDLVKANGKTFVIASELVSQVAEIVKWESFEVEKTVLGKELLGLEYQRPILDKTAPVIKGHHVTTDAGTGLVHMAPLFGEDDYLIGKDQDLEMIMHVDGKGYLTEEAGQFAGLFYGVEGNIEIGKFLEAKGSLLSLKFLKHSYPHDWRTHKPVIYRGVPQWFVNIKPIKQNILDALKDVKSTPEWGVPRIAKMIEGRTEWTISRQRTWGVPIIVFYDKDNNPVIKEELFDHVINLVKEHGTDIWWEKETDELLPESYRNQGFSREMDIMDVWFDSGSSTMSVKPGGLDAPFDVYLEGSDQYRGWFNSSLINSVAYRGKSPYKNLISHGFVLDGKQQKMSKSKGNVVNPLQVISKNGADILRLWAANSEFTSDVSISDDILKQNIEIYRRVRNTFRFMLGNLSDFDGQEVELKDLHAHVAHQISEYSSLVTKLYDEYRFLDIVKETNKLFIDLSGWYFDYAKDVLYCDAQDGINRRSIQLNIFNVLRASLFALAPIIPTTAEEVYKQLNIKDKKESIFLETELEIKSVPANAQLVKFEKTYRFEANRTLEEARKAQLIKRNNEAILTVAMPEEDRFVDENTLAKYLMVAKVKFGNEWKVETFDSAKCQRCWNHFAKDELNEDVICSRCFTVTQKA